MAKHGEPPLVLFSCEVLKINRRGEAVPRTLLVCANSIFLLDADARRGARRKIPLRSLASLRMSEMSDNFLAMVCPAEYDLLLVCGRKTELVVVLREAHSVRHGGARDGAAIEKDEADDRSTPAAAGEERTSVCAWSCPTGSRTRLARTSPRR